MVKKKFLIEVETRSEIGSILIADTVNRIYGVESCRCIEQFNVDPAECKTFHSAVYDVEKSKRAEYGVYNELKKEMEQSSLKVYQEIRRSLVLQAICEAFPDKTRIVEVANKFNNDPIKFSYLLSVEMKANGVTIRHFYNHKCSELPSNICCIYQDDTPIHFFNYL